MIQLLPIVLAAASLVAGQHRPSLAVQPGQNVAVVGDSTSNDINEWPRLVAGRLAERYPGVRVVYQVYNCSANRHSWEAPIVVQDGGRPISVFNTSCSGYRASGWTAEIGRFGLGHVFPATPDLLLVALGHNSYRVDGPTYGTELRTLLAAVPRVPTVLVTQNPERPATEPGGVDRIGYDVLQLQRMDEVRKTSAELGLGLIDMEAVFLQRIALGDWSWIYPGDIIHLSDSGSELFARRVAWELIRPVQPFPSWCAGDLAHPRW